MDIREVKTRLDMSGDDFSPCGFFDCSSCGDEPPRACKKACCMKMLRAIFDAVDAAYA